jgi:hypothetical protein
MALIVVVLKSRGATKDAELVADAAV